MDKRGRLCPIISAPSPSPTKMKAKKRYKPTKTKKKWRESDTRQEISTIHEEWGD